MIIELCSQDGLCKLRLVFSNTLDTSLPFPPTRSEKLFLVQPLFKKFTSVLTLVIPAGGATMIDGFEHVE